MITISNTDAVELVRKNLEELDTDSSDMLSDYDDNASLDSIIKRNLPEAINAVSLAAPIALLEGVSVTAVSPSVSTDGVLSFSLGSESQFLRLVAFRAADSGIVVTDPIPEASPEGRKQLNKYVRGRYDRPRLVLLQGAHTGPAFQYYTLANPGAYTAVPANAIAQFSIVQEQIYSAETTEYQASRRIRQNIIDYLTAIVMDTYADQRSQIYHQKANSFTNI